MDGFLHACHSNQMMFSFPSFYVAYFICFLVGDVGSTIATGFRESNIGNWQNRLDLGPCREAATASWLVVGRVG
jgi:hypothetical protein